MNKIEDYINSVYKNVPKNQNDVEDLKQEMRSHLLQTVEELKREGKTEEESIEIAISRFGSCDQVENELSKIFKIQKRFAKRLFNISMIALLLAAICFIGYIITDDMFRLKVPTSLKSAIENKLETGEQISSEEVNHLLAKYQKQIIYVAIYKEHNFTKTPDILYPSTFPVDKLEETNNNYSCLITYPNLPDDTDWKVVYGFDYDGYPMFIPVMLHFVAIILFIAYWLLFSTWCIINAKYNKNLSLVWIIIFLTLNIVGYMLFALDRMSRLKVEHA